MHDDQQVARLFELDKTLRAGQFPVRWVPDLGFGLGYPLFVFYPPLVYYLGEIFHLLGLSFIDATKLVWFVALVGSGMAMYYLARHFFGKLGGLTSAIFYIYGPYHAVDAYVRGALAELFSFVWLPLVLLFAKKDQVVATSIFLALLMVTHNLIFLPFFGFFVLWSIFFHRGKALRFLLLTTLISFGLTAFFWLPALWEKKFTLVDDLLIKNLASYQIHFVCPWQLWDSPWGYGGSVAGCTDGFSLKVGKVHLLAAVLALVWAVIRKKKPMIFVFSLLAIALFMTTEYSVLIWSLLTPLWYLQFPWRFLEFATLFSALLAGSFRPKIVLIALLIAVVGVGAKYFVPQKQYLSATDSALTSSEEIKWRVSGTTFEYLPKGITTKTTELGTVGVDITAPEALAARPQFPYQSNSPVATPVSFGTVNFPGWTVWIDGHPSAIMDDNKYKLITVQVPAGQHVVTAQFENTWDRTVGNGVSLVSLVGLVVYLFYETRRRQK